MIKFFIERLDFIEDFWDSVLNCTEGSNRLAVVWVQRGGCHTCPQSRVIAIITDTPPLNCKYTGSNDLALST